MVDFAMDLLEACFACLVAHEDFLVFAFVTREPERYAYTSDFVEGGPTRARAILPRFRWRAESDRNIPHSRIFVCDENRAVLPRISGNLFCLERFCQSAACAIHPFAGYCCTTTREIQKSEQFCFRESSLGQSSGGFVGKRSPSAKIAQSRV